MKRKRRPDPFERFFAELDAAMREQGAELPVPTGTFNYLCRMSDRYRLPKPDWAVPVPRPGASGETIG